MTSLSLAPPLCPPSSVPPQKTGFVALQQKWTTVSGPVLCWPHLRWFWLELWPTAPVCEGRRTDKQPKPKKEPPAFKYGGGCFMVPQENTFSALFILLSGVITVLIEPLDAWTYVCERQQHMVTALGTDQKSPKCPRTHINVLINKQTASWLEEVAVDYKAPPAESGATFSARPFGSVGAALWLTIKAPAQTFWTFSLSFN